jgi:hypothetical protein
VKFGQTARSKLRLSRWRPAFSDEARLAGRLGKARENGRVRRFLQIVLVLLLLTGGGGAWYLYRKGFSKSWREWVVNELRDHGAEVSFGKLTVEPFRGLVARDVKIYDTPERKRVLARVNEMVVEANYARAARREPFIEALTLVDASLKLPLDPRNPDGASVSIEKLNTRLLLQADQLLVSRLEAVVAGIRVSASGQLSNPSALTLRSKPPGNQPPLVLRILDELRQVRHEGAPARIDIRFNGDAARPEAITAEVDIAAEKMVRGDYRVESLAVSAVWKNGALTLPRFDVRDSVGRLQLSASYDTTTQKAEMHLRSGIDLPALARALGLGDVGELRFLSVPQAELTGRLSLAGAKPEWLVFGRVSVGQFIYGRVPFERFHADVSWDGRRWSVRDFLLRHPTRGELSGDAQQDYDQSGRGDFRLGLKSTLNPEVLTPLALKISPRVAERLAMLKFHEAPPPAPPAVVINLSARGPSPLDSAASGDLTLGRTTYRGMEAQNARASLRYSGRVLYVDDLFVRRTEGVAGGDLIFDFPSDLVYVKQVRTAVHPMEVALWIDPTLLPDIKPYRFGRKPPTTLIDGVVDQRPPGPRTRLTVDLDGTAMTYEFCGKDLNFTNVSSKLLFVGDRLKISGARAELYGGTMKGEADVSLIKARPGHVADLKFTDVDFTSLTKLYFDYDESQGKLNGTYRFTGAGDDARVMRGEGELTVTEGNVFAIPFLGPLSEILNKIVPGMGYNRARRASTKFTLGDGVITTKGFVVEGRGFSMIGDGKIWFLDDRMDFDMRINAQGLPGILLFPVSKLLEVRAVSKFSKPEWRPKVIPTMRPGERKERGKPAGVQ